MNEALRLLLIEDNEEDAELVRLELERGGFALSWRRVDTEHALRDALTRQDWDVIISDFAMPHFDGLHAYQVVRRLGVDVPFIYVSGALGEERAVEAMRAGARDYLLKGQLTRLSVAVRRELAVSLTRRSESRLKVAARQEQLRYEMAVEASGAGIFELHSDPAFPPYVSPRLLEILGYDDVSFHESRELTTWGAELLHPDDREQATQAFAELYSGRLERISLELRLLHQQGQWVDVALFANVSSRSKTGQALVVVGGLMDLTERKRLEVQLRQAQKMEAIGRLAGGVAHDFNNLLTAIFTFSRLAMDAVDPNSPVYRDIEEVLKAGKRAQALTSQLLAFSRRKAIAPKVINVNVQVRDLERMLQRIVGEDVRVETKLADDLWNTKVDPGSLEQVVVNLAVNARDAMPNGGLLKISTKNDVVRGAETLKLDEELRPGKYVSISVEDTGVGMDEATRRKIFEPFFTTKKVGQGTGLGLSTCYGIISQAGGYIWANSEPGRGTTFEIRLPITSESEKVERDAPLSKRKHGRETIMVVEDEEQLRRLTVRVLESFGYAVVQADNGRHGLEVARALGKSIDLLLTDVVMPELSGNDLAKELSHLFPQMRVLFMSGYTADAIAHRGVLKDGTNLLDKPFTPDSLGQAVRQVLDARG